MAMKEKLLAYLDAHSVAYQHTTHPTAYTAREVASAEHLPEHMVAKTVVFLNENGYGMAILPADTVVNLEELRIALGFHRLRLATEPELVELFPNCELGAMPPFGNGALFELPVYADSSMVAEDTIAFNAGTHRDVVRMAWKDYQRLVKPTIVHFAQLVAGSANP